MNSFHDIGLCILLAAAAAGCQSAYADDKRDPRKDYAYPAGSADPSASAKALEPDPKRPDGKRPWAPSFSVAFPDGPPSPAPAREEWEKAPEAPEVRVTNPGCKAQRIREWYRIECSQMELITGKRDDVSFECRKREADQFGCDVQSVVFPARRGDRRAFEALVWSKYGMSPNAIVTEQFLDGDPYPLITVHGLHWGF